VPSSSVPAAASVAEAVLMDHPEPRIVEPKIVHPSSAAPSVPPLEVPSPGLQPSNGAPPSPEEPLNKA